MALEGFIAAAARRGIRAGLTRRTMPGAVGQFDAYLIREDTSPVGGAVYRFVRAVEGAGRVSIDDFRSLIRCGNKAYQAVLFGRTGIPIPKTLLWFRGERRVDAAPLGYPLIVKRPDGAFSRDVHKCESERELLATGARLFRRSPVLVLQEFVASDFDWRIGVCASKPIFAVMYRYPPGSWKIADYNRAGQPTFGRTEAVPLDGVPPAVVKAAVAAAGAIGAGLYGVDVKATANGVCVLEVNDNPDIDHGVEAAFGPDRVYGTIIETLACRARERAD
jgi:glutathione synthase/RimK-type ligase-like ATP-grasp enzyme